MKSLSTWSERRPPRTEDDRAKIAQACAAHLPKIETPYAVMDRDIEAMKAAFIKRFDEDLPRTETLFAVAAIGYRMALRDMARKD
jgi:hypothetical protein